MQSPDRVNERPAVGLSPAARRLLWIIAYYACVGIAIAVAWRVFPAARTFIELGRLRDIPLSEVIPKSGAAAPELEATSGWNQGVLALATLAGALLTALPVAWVYSLTRRRKGFEQSMVHTLILLPIAVAGMVVLIQNSLALAFSLAGIVAMLRFRNTLEDTKDGVYVFVATSIGISAAVGSLVIGIVTSIVFNVSVLALWWIDFARQPTPGIRGGLARLARLPKLAPTRRTAERDGASVNESVGDDVFASAARAWRRQLRLTAEHRLPVQNGRSNAVLRVHTSDRDTSQPEVERILRERAKQWELIGIVPTEGGRVTLEYQLYIRKDARGELITAVSGTPKTLGAEIRRVASKPGGASR